MPTRTKNINSSFQVTYRNSGGYIASTVCDYVTSNRSQVWSNMPNFRKVARQDLVTQSYTDSSFEDFVLKKTVYYSDLNGGCWSDCISPSIASVPSVADSDPQECLAQAITSAMSKVADTTVDLGVTYAERERTITMFSNAVRDISSAMRDVRAGRFQKAAQRLGLRRTPKHVSANRSFASNWLEYRYGWRLIVMDVDGAVKHLAQSMIDRPPILRVKSNVTNSRPGSVLEGWTGWRFAALGDESCYRKVSYFINSGASITYKYRITNLRLSNLNQLGLINPASLAWELIPFSFVVDWFLNVGDVLKSLSAFSGKTLVDGTQCVWKETIAICEVTGARAKKSNYPLVYSYGTGGNLTTKWVGRAFSRTRLTNFAGVMPRADINLNVNRIVDAMSLVKQRWR